MLSFSFSNITRFVRSIQTSFLASKKVYQTALKEVSYIPNLNEHVPLSSVIDAKFTFCKNQNELVIFYENKSRLAQTEA